MVVCEGPLNTLATLQPLYNEDTNDYELYLGQALSFLTLKLPSFT